MQNDKNMEDIVRELKNKTSADEAPAFLNGRLNPEETRRLGDLLSDGSELEKLLSSPQLRNMLRQVSGDENG